MAEYTPLHIEIIDKYVSITPDLSPDLAWAWVEGVRVELQQVLVNLILNGCDAMMNVDLQRRKRGSSTSRPGSRDGSDGSKNHPADRRTGGHEREGDRFPG